MSFLPYGHQSIDADDIKAVTDVLQSDFLTCGPTIEQFETDFAQCVKAPHAVVCANGTAALHLAMLALDLKAGDVVIVPSMTFLATANAVRFVGADVLFADVNPDTGLMGVAEFQAALDKTDTVKAVIPVHMNGQCTDLPEIYALAKRHNITVIEDACHALGTTYQGHKTGRCAHSDMTIFSFHPVKAIAMGEGGAITCRDEALMTRLKCFRNHGMTRINASFYEMHEVGYNYRASDLHCALGISQLKKLPQFIEKRQKLSTLYDELLQPLAPLLRPVTRVSNCEPALHLYAVLIDFDAIGLSRTTLMQHLRDHNIGTQIHYFPVHRQPYYQKLYGDNPLPGADKYYEHCLSLPLFYDMESTDVGFVVKTLESLL